MSFEKMEEKKEFGKNIHAVIEFGRHEVPGKTPEGMSADYLKPAGQEKAKIRGSFIEEDKIGGYASPKLRAQETIDLEMQSTENVEVINRKLEDLKNSKGEDINIKDDQKEGSIFRIKTKKELDTVQDFGKIMGDAKEWAKKEIDGGSKRKTYDLIVQFYLDNAELCVEKGVITPREAAAEIATRAFKELGMTERFYKDTDIRLTNITHGPKLEPFLQQILINENGEKGFESLEEIGGALNPGESFEFDVQIDKEGNKVVKLKLKGKVYNIDLEEIEKLYQEYKEKHNKDKE
jgi:hypothetical protein